MRTKNKIEFLTKLRLKIPTHTVMSITYKYLELAQKLIDTYPGSALGYDNAYIEELEDHICEAEKGDKHIIDQKAEKTIRDMRFEYKGCPPFFDALFKKDSENFVTSFLVGLQNAPHTGKITGEDNNRKVKRKKNKT